MREKEERVRYSGEEKEESRIYSHLGLAFINLLLELFYHLPVVYNSFWSCKYKLH